MGTDLAVTQREAGRGLWALLSSFPADPVTVESKTTKAQVLERKCELLSLGKDPTESREYVGTTASGRGRRGREQRIPASAAPQPRGGRTAVP